MSDRKKAFSINGDNKISIRDKEKIEENDSLKFGGVGGGILLEGVPNYVKADNEKVVAGDNNTWIVLGRDRPSSRVSGYGGRGDTQAGSIDIVVGRMASEAKSLNENNQSISTDPNFQTDSARIHISQKTDVDDNFNLVSGKVGNSKTKSAVAMKADGIRIIAREGIKLVTRTDRKNSQGADVVSANGIDLLATNDDSLLQPLVKGDNLVEALERLATQVSKINGIVDSLLIHQSQLNEAVANHTHYGPANIIPVPPLGFIWETAPSFPLMAKGIKTMIDHLSQTKQSLVVQKFNLGSYQSKYLKPFGDKYINSRYNNTT
jgi:hypothetical protein